MIFSLVTCLALTGLSASMPASSMSPEALPTMASPGMNCSGMMNITVTNNWMLPTTMIAPNQDCRYNFFIPNGFYPVLDFRGDKIYMSDLVMFFSNFSYDDQIVAQSGTFRSNLAWPTNILTVWIHTNSQTNLTLSISVTAMKAMPSAKIISSRTTDKNKPAVEIYPDTWEEGTSYEFTSKTGRISVAVASLGDSYQFTKWNNLFVYENDVLVGSMRSLTIYHQYVSTAAKVTLYLVKTIDLTGAVQVTDNSNIESFKHYGLLYVPLDSCNGNAWYGISGDSQTGAAFTLVGKRDGSTPINVEEISNNSKGILSLLGGGPMADHSRAHVLNYSNIPKKFLGNSWTLYITSDYASVKIHAYGGNITCI